MRVLIFGGNGMLGHKLVQQLKNEFDVWVTLRGDLVKYQKFDLFEKEKTLTGVDVESEKSVAEAVSNVRPDVIINAVGIIKQIPSSKNVIKTLTVNSIFPHRLAEIVQQINSRLITISTDCVFDGKKGNYVEDDISNALDLYGKSKYLGEVTAENCLTIRTSIIGRELETAHSLVEWFLNQKTGTVRGYVNAKYTGFPTIVLSRIIADLLKNFPNLSGLYHVSSEPISKYDLLCLIRDELDLDIEIEPFADFYLDRSLSSAKFSKDTGFQAPEWKLMIREFAADPFQYEKIRAGLINSKKIGFNI